MVVFQIEDQELFGFVLVQDEVDLKISEGSTRQLCRLLLDVSFLFRRVRLSSDKAALYCQPIVLIDYIVIIIVVILEKVIDFIVAESMLAHRV